MEVQDLHLHGYVLALDITTNRNTNMDTHLVNIITSIIQNGYIHATSIGTLHIIILILILRI